MWLRTLLAVLTLSVGCSGRLSDEQVHRPDGPVPPQTRCETRATTPGVRHLTRDEYDRTVRDLLGTTSAPGRSFPPDDAIGGFEVGATVSPILVEAQFEAADRLGEEAARDATGLLGCEPSTEGCVDGFLARFLRRAYRRPAEAGELTRARALYESGRADGGPTEGVHRLVAGVLASPQFYYHLPPGRGAPGEVVQLDGWELASRLSYFLWGTMPDAELDASADAGALSDPAILEAQARRMLDDPRAREGIAAFFRQWLELDHLDGISKDPNVHPEMNRAATAALRGSMERYVEHVFFETDARLETLLLAPIAFFDGQLAQIYGVPGIEGDDFVRVELDPSQRAGLLTQPGLLALHGRDASSDPIHRGLFVRQRVLCHELPTPPADADLVVPDSSPEATTRERFAEHTANASCRSCHQLIDPIGFVFEHYDAIGGFRTEEHGLPVDVRGELLATEDADGPIEGALELSARLADSWQVSECMVRQWMRFALARTERAEDSCEIQRLRRQLILTGGDLRELVIAIVGSDAFRVRRIPTGGDDV